MVLIKRASEADFIFVPSEYSNEIRVLRFDGVEGISKPFHYRLKLASLDSVCTYRNGHYWITLDQGL